MHPSPPPVFLPKHTAMIICARFTRNSLIIHGIRTKATAPKSIAGPLKNSAFVSTIAKASISGRFSQNFLIKAFLFIKLIKDRAVSATGFPEQCNLEQQHPTLLLNPALTAGFFIKMQGQIKPTTKNLVCYLLTT